MKSLALLAAAALTAVAASTATAAEPPPAFNGCGIQKKDSNSDATDTVGGNIPEAEIVEAWAHNDAAKGADGITVNIAIKNLTGRPPVGATSVTYNAIFGGAGGETSFVRAHIDLAGIPAFEYGHLEPLGPSTRYAYDGPTKGQLFLGESGVAQIVLPPEAGAKPGATLKGLTAQSQVGRTTVVPSVISQSPSRGLSFQNDDLGLGSFAVGVCAGSTPATGGGTPTTPTSDPAPAPTQQSESLPVTLKTTKVKRAKKGRAIALKLSSSEPIKDLGARLAKGRSAFATGKLASLNGDGTIKLKLSKALKKKGTYVLDMAGTTGDGRRRLSSFKLTVR